MLSERDRQIIGLIEEFKVANVDQIYRLFYSNVSTQYCRKRLLTLTEQGHLKRTRSHIDQGFMYYLEKVPSQADHKLYLLELYIQISRMYKILRFDHEFTCGNLRADAYMEIAQDGHRIGYFVEIQLNHKIDFNKYDTLYKSNIWKETFPSFPKVLVLSNRKDEILKSPVKFTVVRLDFSNLTL